MRWPWRRTPKASAESEVALRQAERALHDAKCRDDAAREVTDRLRETRARNHFGEAVARSMRRA
jgi:hypothetical protein